MDSQRSHRKRGVVLTEQGQQKLQRARQQVEIAENAGDRYTLEELSERTKISLKTVTKVLEACSTVDKSTLEAFFQAFHLLLERQDYRYPSHPVPSNANPGLFPPSAPAPPRKTRIDWGEAPDVSIFYGRQAELTQLRQWIEGRDRVPRRLIAILGMGGMGKTALATKLLHEVIDNANDCPFDVVIWRSLRNAPTLDVILAQWLDVLSLHQETRPSLQSLLTYLQRYRCLLVLDNLETILGGAAGVYRQGYEDYGELLRLIGETPHQSSVIVTSREKTIELSTLEGDSLPVCCLPLKGSGEASHCLLQAKGLNGTVAEQKQLCDRYSNSPLAIKIIAATIQDLFEGEIGEFLQEETVLFQGIRRLLDQQFERMSNLEQSIMFWLAINRDWTSIDELSADLLPATARSKILEAISSLHWRNLIEKKQGAYTQQPIVMEYVTERLSEQISAELLAMNEQPPSLLHRYALLKTTVKDYVRDSQRRLIVDVVARELQLKLGSHRPFSPGSETRIAQHLKRCLAGLRPAPLNLAKFSAEYRPEPSYAAGNILNLLCHLNIDLAGCDCSGLAVWHAYLPNVSLSQTNFAHADLERSQLTDVFGAVFAVAFSPDGTYFYTGELSGYLRRWQVNNGQAIWTVKACNSRIHSIAVSPDGTIVALGAGDQTIELWNAITGESLRSLIGHRDQVYCVTFHPTQPLLASASGDTTIRLWDAQSGRCLAVFAGEEGHTGQVKSVCFSPQGDFLVSSSSDRTIRIWHLSTKTLQNVLTGHEDQVLSVAIHPQGKWLASSSSDGTIKLWQFPQGTPIKSFKAHTSHVFAVQFSPDGSLLASSGSDQTIRLWHSQTGQSIRILQSHNHWIRSIWFNPHKHTLLSGCSDYTIKLWDIDTGQVLRTWLGYNNSIWAVDVSGDGTKIVSGGGDRAVRVWDMQTGNCLQTMRGHSNWVLTAACNHDGSLVASGGDDHAVMLWQTSSGKVYRKLTGHTSQILFVQFSPNGSILASSSDDCSIRLWDLASGQELKVLCGHKDWIRSLSFSPDGKRLASAGQDCIVNLWDVHTGDCLQTWQAFDTWVWSVRFHPNGHHLVTASGSTLQLWDSNTGSFIRSYQGHDKRIRSVVISPNGKWLASGGQDNLIHLWSIKTGEILKTFLGHTDQVISVRFSPDNCYLVSGGADEMLNVWNVETGQLQRTLKTEGLYEGMRISGVTGLSEEAIATLIKLGANLDD